ncbi:glycosyltransferase [Patescibacteria group bacterium]|nr:glycosyltransferase [Patescibacteria group bacterium]MBU4098742.1 glycosyltransferase [Patescibacteria group bacterium]
MRIGIYDPYLDTLSGGEKYMLTAASCLSAENEVTIFWDDPRIIEKAYKKLRIDLSKTTVMPNIFSPKMPFLNRLFETRAYDLLFILSDGSIPVTLAKRTILHFQFPVEWVRAGDLISRIKLMKINSIICNSEFTRKFIDKKFRTNSKILYPPCVNIGDIEKFSSQKKAGKKNIILTVGRYSPLSDSNSIKKIEVMINAFRQMVKGGLRNWQFIAAVSFLKENEKYLSQLEDMIKDQPIKIIKNCGFDELEKLYNQAKIYWHAAGYQENLEKNPERAEHFGITTVEAMAHKIVPVVIEKGGQPEIIDDNINGFLWETEEELIQKTKKLMIDESLSDQMANLAQKKSLEFTTEKFCKELQKII